MLPLLECSKPVMSFQHPPPVAHCRPPPLQLTGASSASPKTSLPNRSRSERCPPLAGGDLSEAKCLASLNSLWRGNKETLVSRHWKCGRKNRKEWRSVDGPRVVVMLGFPWKDPARWRCGVLRLGGLGMMPGVAVRASVSAGSGNVMIECAYKSLQCRRVMLTASVLVVAAACLLPRAHGSAIPMWEYLSRGEKMSHLFNLFVQQVEKHCASRPEPDCSKLLLVYGLTNLAKMEDESLDGMDPYQRGASEIVWDSMMKGSSKHNHVGGYATKPSSTPAVAVTPTANFIEPTAGAEDLDGSDPGSLEAASNIDVKETEPQSFLLGPMVVRVLPNGMPIPGEKNHLPRDEDIEELAPTRFRSFPASHQPSTNKLGYGEHSPGYYTPRFHHRPSHDPAYHSHLHPYDARGLAPPAYRPNPPNP